VISEAVTPVAVVMGSKVVLQLPHTWLKQQFGVQV
jgi:hypothetical protein